MQDPQDTAAGHAATGSQVRDLARTIAAQAQAIADGTLIGPVHAAARRIRANADTLAAWTAPAREQASPEEQDADRAIRHDFNACQLAGMSRPASISQAAAAHATTAERVRAALARTEYETAPRDLGEAMQVTIVHNSDTNATVHKAGCADIRRREMRHRAYLSSYDVEAATRQDAAEDAWSDFIGESMDAETALAYTTFYPCAAALPERAAETPGDDGGAYTDTEIRIHTQEGW